MPCFCVFEEVSRKVLKLYVSDDLKQCLLEAVYYICHCVRNKYHVGTLKIEEVAERLLNFEVIGLSVYKDEVCTEIRQVNTCISLDDNIEEIDGYGYCNFQELCYTTKETKEISDKVYENRKFFRIKRASC